MFQRRRKAIKSRWKKLVFFDKGTIFTYLNVSIKTQIIPE